MVHVQTVPGQPQDTIVIVLRLEEPRLNPTPLQPEQLSPRARWEEWRRNGAEIFARSIRDSGVPCFGLVLEGGTLGQASAAPGEGFQAAQTALTALRRFVAKRIKDPNPSGELVGRCLSSALETLTKEAGLSGCKMDMVRTPYHHKNTLLTVPCLA